MSPALAPWATDFLLQQPAQSPRPLQLDAGQSAMQNNQTVHALRDSANMASPFQGKRLQWTPPAVGFASPMGNMMHQPQASGSQLHQPVHSAPILDESQWEQVFKSHEETVAVLRASQEVTQEHPAQRLDNPDELARTAGSLIDAVRHEDNPKFQSSAFLGLMRQLRDREIVIEGNQMVPREEASSWANDLQSSVDVKGKGRAVDIADGTITSSMVPGGDSTQVYAATAVAGQRAGDEQVRGSLSSAVDDLDEYFRQENEAYIGYWRSEAPPRTETPRENAEWGRLQRDWDNFEATATGIRPVANYQFQAHNPYLVGETSRHHAMHIQGERNTLYDSVLEMEAAVQREPMSAQAWFQLGVKQQENEREAKAVQALRRALELDPTHLPSWLALAVSHTNEGNRHGAFEAVREWVDHNEQYRDVASAYRLQKPLRQDMSQTEKFNDMIDCLITMARSDTSGEIDADIQIALAVLMNTNEAYEKAKDCFTTALAVRPDDWQLYNRVGATLANSGKPEEALAYYYRALELNPAYIRARFNLGISCINLRRHQEASEHILDALSLQENDSITNGDGTNDKRGVTSSTLWDSLKTCCLHLGRLDLATICDRRDLDTFRLNFNLR
ncbi:uncharacterized protein PHACADRAFT_258401 [Phanerochaete carnosa HHB-10118-sp]|uniref:Uncharacterized protein n=1 Tax=Phanerochaete carnosa (strain HHB-10118-sp) TaxID=650164 RepID=K5W6D2_PHACS|nr:uncharacterized protein PHACADRAFT_258401 [Phanerochaete carnosa HHB-10118-sp]EKM54509.1 hypothetical protein PHACADRAFT_258401 [Phanerochaete carnosa HHB-10118-sp]